MAFDEVGQADTTERKVEICSAPTSCSPSKVGFDPPNDIIFDPNILAIATGLEEHNGYGKSLHRGDATQIKEALPGRADQRRASATSRSRSAATTSCARRCTPRSSTTRSKAGMDMGIVNAGQLAVYEDIEPELRSSSSRT